MTDRYVIVFQKLKKSGAPIQSAPLDKNFSDWLLADRKRNKHLKLRPAYRIRIREKPARLDPAKAYADAGIRR